MRIERSYDFDLIERIIAHPTIYPYVSDDGSPPPEEYRAISGENIYYLLVKEGNETLGVFMVHPHNTVLYEIHTCMLPVCRGALADQAAKLVLDWIFKNTPCRKLMTHVPIYNHMALSYAKRAGLVEEGVNRASFLKDGKLYDQTLLGVIKCQ